jgi:hypothetical protein
MHRRNHIIFFNFFHDQQQIWRAVGANVKRDTYHVTWYLNKCKYHNFWRKQVDKPNLYFFLQISGSNFGAGIVKIFIYIAKVGHVIITYLSRDNASRDIYMCILYVQTLNGLKHDY